MRHLRITHLLPVAIPVLLLALGSGPSQASTDPAGGSPTLAAINAALQAGEISPGQAILYKLCFIRGAGLLPKSLAVPGDRIKCGTGIAMEALDKLSGLEPGIRVQVEQLMARPSLDSFVDTAHFRIHYATSGSNMIYQWPNSAYLDTVKTAAEKAYARYVALGWQIPPSDGTAGGGNGLIDIYVLKLSGVYGVTFPDVQDGRWPNSYTAFLEVDNDYAGFGYADRTLPLKITVAHEYHHVIQMGYVVANRWWMENMATFEEDEVYPGTMDNCQYLPCYAGSPYRKASTSDGCFEYGCFLWPRFLTDNWTDALVRDVQACAATQGVFTCFDQVLNKVSSTYSNALAEWQLWNFYTWARDTGSHYHSAADYHVYLATDRTVTSYPISGQHPENPPEAAGAGVIRFDHEIGSNDDVLTVGYDGPLCTRQVVLISKKSGQDVFQETYMKLDQNGEGQVQISGWKGMDYAYLIVSMAQECGSAAQDFIFGAETSLGQTGVGEPLYTRTVNLDQNVPNPFGPETRINYRLAQAGPVSLLVFDAAGRQVRTLIHTSQDAGAYSIRWDGRDDSGRSVAPGVYFYRLDTAGASGQRKMIVAR